MRLIPLAAAFALLLGAGGPAAADDLSKVTIGVAPVVPTASTYLALKKGYLREAGFDVTIESVDTAAKLLPFLASNRMQVAEGGIPVGFFNAVAQGQPVVLALDAGSSPINQDLLVRPDLKGRSVAVVALASIQSYVMAKLLDTAGLTLKDIDLKTVPFPMMGAAFANKAIDAALEVPPFGDLVVERGLAVRWLDPDKMIRPTPMSVVAYMVNTDWAAQNRDAAHRLFLALARAGRDYCQAYHHGPNRAEVAETLVENRVIADRALVERMPWQARDPNGRFNLESVMDIQDRFFRLGLIDKKAPAERLVDTSYAEAAAKALGPFEPINQSSTLEGCR